MENLKSFFEKPSTPTQANRSFSQPDLKSAYLRSIAQSQWTPQTKGLQQVYQQLQSGTEGPTIQGLSETGNVSELHVVGLQDFLRELGLTSSDTLRLPANNPVTGQAFDWNQELQPDKLNAYLKESSQEAKKSVDSENAEIDRLQKIMMLALSSGNIGLAMTLFAHLEARQANSLTKSLLGKVQEMQNKKRDLSLQIADLDPNDNKSMQQAQRLKTDVDTLNDDTAVLQTFIKEVNQNKSLALEFSTNFLSQEHQTTMSVVRSMGR